MPEGDTIWRTAAALRERLAGRRVVRSSHRWLEGRTVGESGLRNRYGISVLAIKRLTRDGIQRRFVPGPEDRLDDPPVGVLSDEHDLGAAAIDRLGRLIRADDPL